MLYSGFYLFFVVTMCLDFVMSQHSDAGFSYDRIPMRPISADKNHRIPSVRPKPRPSKRPSQGGSRYLRGNKPGKKNLDKSVLMQLMGDDYQTFWMSDEKPQKPMIPVPSHEVNLDGLPVRWALQETLFDQIQELNLTAELSSLQPELLPLKDLITTWLLKRSSCPVQFIWKDLGSSYWPRWLRKGECLDRKGTCSFPTGMHCVPAASTEFHLLRWQCQERKMTIVKKSAESKTAEDATQKRRKVERTKGRQFPNVKTSEDATQTRRAVDRHFSRTKTEVEVMYRRRVADLSPEQKRRRKRCNWRRVPIPITIDCFCTC